ncbi:MAG: hypothetical protein R3C20_16130 [Planctomycetaceae bacterium]
MSFHFTTATLLTTIIVLLIAGACCWISWKRSGFAKRFGWLELLRFAIVVVVLITLNQPEVTRRFVPDERPTIVVLHDVSQSMQTRDVVTETSEARSPDRRRELVDRLIQPERWSAAEGRVDIVFEPFSSSLANPEKATDLNSALILASEQHTSLRGVVLLSDGDWNLGSAPHVAATSLRMKKVPVFAVGIGSEQRLPDVELTGLDAPTFGVIDKNVRVPFRLMNWLPRDLETVVTLTGTDGAEIEKRVRIPGMGQLQDTIEWRPAKTGDYELTLKLPVDDREAVADNNELSFPITIRQEALKVLIVESYPRWEYRYLRNALERDPGVEVNCLLFHPDLEGVGGGRGYLETFPDENQLFEYDVVFLGDVGVDSQQLTVQNCELLGQLVRSHAGGLVFLPGFRGKQLSLLTTELEELYPVVPDEAQPRGVGSSRPARFALTEAGRRSLLTRLEADDDGNERIWRDLPGFQWYAASLRAKVGTEVLVTHDADTTKYGRIPLIATRPSGTGKVLFMGTDGAWRWRKGVEDLYHYRFWGQVVRWMAYQRNMSQGERMRLFYSPDRPEADNVLTLNVNAMTDAGEPLREGRVTVHATSPSGHSETIRLKAASSDSWGLFTGTFVPGEGGVWKLVTLCEETGATLETDVSIQGLERERIGQPARFDVLREVAEISRGRVVDASDLSRLVDDIAQLPEPEPVIRRVRIWSHPLWGALIVLMLGAFWTGRKLAGLA